MDIHDFVKAIEPLQATTANATPEEDLLLMSATSAAVSLKRIADALDKASVGKGLDAEGLAHAVFAAVDKRMADHRAGRDGRNL